MKYSRSWLKQEFNNRKEIKYFFFWGHKQKNPAEVDKSCLSQWFPAEFKVDGITYPTAEHWMMVEKAKLFKDEEALEKMLQTDSPGAVKALGRTVKNFDQDVWAQQSYNIVVQGSIHKFSQNEAMKAFLMITGNKIIVEASPRDTIWGIGLGQDNPKAQHPDTWRGANKLGFALMEARDHFLNSQS